MKQSKPTTQSTRLTALEARQAEMEARIAHLEREVHRNFPNPWITPVGPYPSTPIPLPAPQWDENGALCRICGLKYSEMTHYVCGHDRCPSLVTFGTAGGGISVTTSASTPDHLVGVATQHGGSTFHQPSHFAGATIRAGTGPYGAPGTIPTSKTNPTP